MKLEQGFVEQVVLLILTAIVSGFGIPYILKKIEEKKLRQAKVEDKIVEEQARLLDDLSRLFWKWRYLAKQVVYFGAVGKQEQYASSKEAYESEIWTILESIRVEISKSRRLVSEVAFNKLNSLYEYIVRDIDVKVSNVIKATEPDTGECRQLASRFSSEVSTTIDDAMDELASDMNLKVKK